MSPEQLKLQAKRDFLDTAVGSDFDIDQANEFLYVVFYAIDDGYKYTIMKHNGSRELYLYLEKDNFLISISGTGFPIDIIHYERGYGAHALNSDEAKQMLDTINQESYITSWSLTPSEDEDGAILGVIGRLDEYAAVTERNALEKFTNEVHKYKRFFNVFQSPNGSDARKTSKVDSKLKYDESETEQELFAKEDISFDDYSTILVTGEKGTGKSSLIHEKIQEYADQLSVKEIKIFIFDCTADTIQLIEELPQEKCVYLDNVDDCFDFLEVIADLAQEEAARNNANKKRCVAYIEGSDMPQQDQKAFDRIVATIADKANQANIQLIYSTYRPAPDTVSTQLLEKFDLVVAGKLSTRSKYNYVGLAMPESHTEYRFITKDTKKKA